MSNVAEEVSKWADEVKEQQDFAQILLESLESMGVARIEEVDVPLLLDSMACEGLRLAKMDSDKNIASLAFFDTILPKT